MKIYFRYKQLLSDKSKYVFGSPEFGTLILQKVNKVPNSANTFMVETILQNNQFLGQLLHAANIFLVEANISGVEANIL